MHVTRKKGLITNLSNNILEFFGLILELRMVTHSIHETNEFRIEILQQY